MDSIRDDLEELCRMVERELGVAVRLTAPAAADSLVHVPKPLWGFYTVSDGLELPFFTLYQSAEIIKDAVQGWHSFGEDKYFQFALCATTADTNPPLALWDHETNLSPEGEFPSVLALLQQEYADYIENLPSPAVCARSIPAKMVTTAARIIKTACEVPTMELVRKLRSPPFTVRCLSSESAGKAVQELNALGCDCILVSNNAQLDDV